MTLTPARVEPFWAGVFASALRDGSCRVHGLAEVSHELPVRAWREPAGESDRVLLRHCLDPCLDIGCGPGRMTQELAATGVRVLGVDLVGEAVDQARRRGVAALKRDVFGPLPGEGRWASALLADGNIGIGGDPGLLLRRVAALLMPGGRVVVDLVPRGIGLRTRTVRLEGNGVLSAPFRWTLVGPEAINQLAVRSGFVVAGLHEYDGRWFAVLHKAQP